MYYFYKCFCFYLTLIGFLDVCNILKYFANREDIGIIKKNCRHLSVDRILDRPILASTNQTNVERNKIHTIEESDTHQRK